MTRRREGHGPRNTARFLAAVLLGCFGGCDGGGEADAGRFDAQFSWPDGALRDAGRGEGGPSDGGPTDGGPDAGRMDGGTGTDAGASDGGPSDGGPSDGGRSDGGRSDGGPSDAGVLCPSLDVGDTLVFDGVGDLAAFPSEQILAPGAPITAGDQFALTWDRDALYMVVATDAFMGDGLRPYHLYLETGSSLPAATASTGKEYDSLRPALAFTPNVLIAFRATDDTGSGAYNGVYALSADWTDRATPLVTGTDLFVRADQGAIAVRVPWTALGGCPAQMRLTGHLVHAVPANEWKTLVPTDATPWGAPGGGGYYEVDLTSDPAIAGWTAR